MSMDPVSDYRLRNLLSQPLLESLAHGRTPCMRQTPWAQSGRSHNLNMYKHRTSQLEGGSTLLFLVPANGLHQRQSQSMK